MASHLEQARWQSAAACVIAMLFLTACGKESRGRKPLALTIHFLADTDGRLEPCGCFSGQYGGLTRVKTWLDGQPTAQTLELDVGNAISGPADYQVIQHRYIQKAYAAMGFDAMNLGQRECQLSLEELRRMAKETPLPVISANVLDAGSREPIFAPYLILERDGYRIGCVGVVDGEGLEAGEGLEIARMETTLSNLLPQLDEETDIIVVLAFTDEERMKSLAREFYEIDLILGGNVKQPSQELIHENRSTILYTTNESRALGVLQATCEPHGRLRAEAFDIQLMHDQIPQDRSIAQLSAAYRDEVRRTRLEIDDPNRRAGNLVPGVDPAAAYVGTENCASCHQTAHEIWEKTAHAHAFATLVKRDAEADPNCIGCHTVGFGTESGYRRAYGDRKLTNVGCESCHGPGSEHVAQRTSGSEVLFKYRPLAAADCQSCHYGEFSRPFDWEVFWPQIKHGSEPAYEKKSPDDLVRAFLSHPPDGERGTDLAR